MAEIAGREVDPDVRVWDDDLRRESSLVLGGLAAVLLLAGIIWFAAAPQSAGTFLWVAIVLLVLLLIAELAVLVTGIAREEDVGPEWLAGPGAERTHATPEGGAAPGPAQEPAPQPAPEIDLQCPECGDLFAVEDTGERPLHTECPHCGAQGEVNLDDLPGHEPPHEHDHEHEHEHGQEAGAAGAAATDEGVPDLPGEEDEPTETIELKCPACDTEFETEDTGERPLKTTCPGCGRSGKLG